MPNTKQFEGISLEGPAFFSPVWLNMYEMSEVFYDNIKQVYSLLAENKIVCTEIPDRDCLVFVRRLSSSEFEIKTRYGSGDESVEKLAAIDLVNWLFASAPFMAMVGVSNGRW